jgi:hypothetical protein
VQLEVLRRDVEAAVVDERVRDRVVHGVRR